jgi:hypothetical protein
MCPLAVKKFNVFINLILTASISHYILTVQENGMPGTVR